MLLGIDNFIENKSSDAKIGRIGLLANQASLNKDLAYSYDIIAETLPGKLAAIFSPQHGLWGEEQANMIETPHRIHKKYNIPIYSLYSETRAPTSEMLSKIDTLIIDLQDVGTRIYTFAWTIENCLKICKNHNIPVIILDRPNPIGGIYFEGPILEKEFFSFVGGISIPMRHGLTIGELSLLINIDIGAELEIILLKNWSRKSFFNELKYFWTPPSPNLPKFDSLLLYPGLVLLEGTNLSEGRGTTTPFEVVGAPFIDEDLFVDHLNSYKLPGVSFVPIRFLPTFDKWKGQSCGGARLYVQDLGKCNAYSVAIAILIAAKTLYPNNFAWLPPPYEYETEKMPIDILAGNSFTRTKIDNIANESANLKELCYLDINKWIDHIQPILLYK